MDDMPAKFRCFDQSTIAINHPMLSEPVSPRCTLESGHDGEHRGVVNGAFVFWPKSEPAATHRAAS